MKDLKMNNINLIDIDSDNIETKDLIPYMQWENENIPKKYQNYAYLNFLAIARTKCSNLFFVETEEKGIRLFFHNWCDEIE